MPSSFCASQRDAEVREDADCVSGANGTAGSLLNGGAAPDCAAVLLTEHAGAAVYHASWRALLDVVHRCNAIIVDAPYSEKTHSGHAKGAMTANRASEWASRGSKRHTTEARYAARGQGERRKINYAAWTPADVDAFVAAWSPRCTGWIVSITDDTLASAWSDALRSVGRYVFAWLPYVAPGSRVRMTGDGPSSWTCWIVVARPRTAEFAHWGTLPGAYILPPGFGEGGAGRAANDEYVVGNKPEWLMERLVEDYSRPGDLIVDPCCGGGTTLRAAQTCGRRAIGGDVMLTHAEMAARRISRPVQARIMTAAEPTAEQRSLFDV